MLLNMKNIHCLKIEHSRTWRDWRNVDRAKLRCKKKVFAVNVSHASMYACNFIHLQPLERWFWQTLKRISNLYMTNHCVRSNFPSIGEYHTIPTHNDIVSTKEIMRIWCCSEQWLVNLSSLVSHDNTLWDKISCTGYLWYEWKLQIVYVKISIYSTISFWFKCFYSLSPNNFVNNSGCASLSLWLILFKNAIYFSGSWLSSAPRRITFK